MSGLQRRLNRIDALAVSLGAVIGVGVFRNTGLVLRGAGGVTGATLLWIVIGVVCLAGAILYADLSTRVPEAGGPYAYVRVAFGGPAAFVYGWMNAGVSMPVRQASISAVIGELLTPYLPGGPRLLAVTTLVLLTILNLLGVRAGAIAQRVFTTGKLGTIGLVIALSIVLGVTGTAPATAAVSPVSFAVAVGAVWYTYLGWQDVVLLAEELHQPRRDLPVVLLGTVALTMALYVGIHLAVYLGLGGGSEAYGDLPALATAQRALGGFGAGLLTVLMLSSMIGGAAEGMLVRPRVAMALARDGLAPAPIAAISRNGTPHVALLFHAAISLALVASGTFEQLLPLLVFAQGFLGVFETASYFVVRRRRPELPTSAFHPWAPLVFILTNAALCVLAGRDDPAAMARALGLIAVVSLVYAVMRPRPKRSDPASGSPSRPDAET
ncbi:MAG TPA: amino acid permease [Kofleriaceae bacterium]|nr:amino acid permease [Kofleriaceae bacterium]